MHLKHFLDQKRVSNNPTHTSMHGASYYIPFDDLELFYLLYSQAILNNQKLSLTERPIASHCPLIIDLDFKQNTMNHLYTTSMIKDIVGVLINVIDQYLILPRQSLYIYVLTKPPRPNPKNNESIKDGLHIIIPHLIVDAAFSEFLRYYTFKTIYDILLPCGYTNSAEDIYDKQVSLMKNYWVLYGSRKPKHDSWNRMNDPRLFDPKEKEKYKAWLNKGELSDLAKKMLGI